MRYIKRGYIRDTAFMAIESEDANFYKGLIISTNKNEDKVKVIRFNEWFEWKSVKYITEDITKEQFDQIQQLAINQLTNYNK